MLKNCPHCGSEGERKEYIKYRKGYRAQVGCKNQLCNANRTAATSHGTPEDAYKYAESAWNDRPTAEWRENEYTGRVECSACGKSLEYYYADGVPLMGTNFCPNCGVECK